MKLSQVGASALAVALLFSVSSSQGKSGPSSETIIYAFKGEADGVEPWGALISDGAGALYGTTAIGGTCKYWNGCGTVFKLTPSSSGYTEQILHSF